LRLPLTYVNHAHQTNGERTCKVLDNPPCMHRELRLKLKHTFQNEFSMRLDLLFLQPSELPIRMEHHSFGPGRFGGEPVFVPRPEGKDEDDGWLVTYVYDENTNESEVSDCFVPSFRRMGEGFCCSILKRL
jgi:hypothetical protein